MSNGISSTRSAGGAPSKTASGTPTKEVIAQVSQPQTAPQATPPQAAQSQTEVNAALTKEIESFTSGNINIDAPKIKKVLDNAPIGSLIEHDSYYHPTAGMLQDQWRKVGAETWEHTWRVKDGEIYWKNNDSSKWAASAIWNAFHNPDLHG